MSVRYPLAALVEASGLSEAEFGRRVGLSGSSLTKARELGLIESAADRYACSSGLVPWLVWSDWLEDLQVECAERSCNVMFVPSRKGHTFCSKVCSRREWQRLRYQSDPAFAASKIESARSYYRENGDYVRKRENRRYRAKRDAA